MTHARHVPNVRALLDGRCSSGSRRGARTRLALAARRRPPRRSRCSAGRTAHSSRRWSRRTRWSPNVGCSTAGVCFHDRPPVTHHPRATVTPFSGGGRRLPLPDVCVLSKRLVLYATVWDAAGGFADDAGRFACAAPRGPQTVADTVSDFGVSGSIDAPSALAFGRAAVAADPVMADWGSLSEVRATVMPPSFARLSCHRRCARRYLRGPRRRTGACSPRCMRVSCHRRCTCRDVGGPGLARRGPRDMWHGGAHAGARRRLDARRHVTQRSRSVVAACAPVRRAQFGAGKPEAIVTPTLVIYGECDEYAPAAEQRELFGRLAAKEKCVSFRVRGALVWCPKIGHHKTAHRTKTTLTGLASSTARPAR